MAGESNAGANAGEAVSFEGLRDWIGRSEQREDVVTAQPVAALAATFDRAAAFLHGLREALARHQEAAGEVVGDHRFPALLVDHHQRRRVLAAGVVDQRMDRAALGDDLLDAGLDRVFVTDVEGDGRALPAVLADLRGNLVELVLLAADQHHERRENQSVGECNPSHIPFIGSEGFAM